MYFVSSSGSRFRIAASSSPVRTARSRFFLSADAEALRRFVTWPFGVYLLEACPVVLSGSRVLGIRFGGEPPGLEVSVAGCHCL